MGKHNRKRQAFDPRKTLSKKVTVKSGNKLVKLSPLESGLRHLVNGALKGDMIAAKRIMNECIAAGILAKRVQSPYSPGRLIIPDQWDDEEWYKMFDQHGFPPWPGDDDGFSEDCRAEYEYWRKTGHHSWDDQR